MSTLRNQLAAYLMRQLEINDNLESSQWELPEDEWARIEEDNKLFKAGILYLGLIPEDAVEKVLLDAAQMNYDHLFDTTQFEGLNSNGVANSLV